MQINTNYLTPTVSEISLSYSCPGALSSSASMIKVVDKHKVICGNRWITVGTRESIRKALLQVILSALHVLIDRLLK